MRLERDLHAVVGRKLRRLAPVRNGLLLPLPLEDLEKLRRPRRVTQFGCAGAVVNRRDIPRTSRPPARRAARRAARSCESCRPPPRASPASGCSGLLWQESALIVEPGVGDALLERVGRRAASARSVSGSMWSRPASRRCRARWPARAAAHCTLVEHRRESRLAEHRSEQSEFHRVSASSAGRRRGVQTPPRRWLSRIESTITRTR